MRRRLYLIILLAAVTLSGMAQNVGDVFYIYRNDGHHDGFHRDEVLSIDYSYEDADGNLYDEVVTQVITTPDSVYKIPLAVIDSISFVQPKTIYHDDVTVLEGELYQYIIGAEGQLLKFKTNTPSSLLPKVGDKIALMEMTDVLPSGFIGVVSSISNQSDAIVLDCATLDILEAVKQYYTVNFVNITTEDNQSPQLLKAPRKSNIGKYHYLPTLSASLEFGSGEFFKHDDFIMKAGASTSVSLTPVLQTKGVVMIDNEVGGYVNVVSIADYDYSWSCKYSGGFTLEKKLSFTGGGVDVPLCPGINFYVDLGVYSGLEGEICWEAGGQDKYRLVMQAIGDLTTPEHNTINHRLTKLSSDPQTSILAGRVTAKVGIFSELGISIISSKLFKLGIEGDMGLKAEVSISANINDWIDAGSSTAFYDRMAAMEEGTVSIGCFGAVKLIADWGSGIIHGDVGVEFDLGPKLFTGGFVPVFDDVSAEWVNPTKKAISQASIERSIFIPVQLGFAAFDKDNNKIETIYDEGTYISNLTKPLYGGTFENLDVAKDYTVYPVIRLFDKEILASPSAELTMDQSVTTFEATDVSEYSATLNGRLDQFSPELPGNVFFRYGTNSNPETTGSRVNAGEPSNLGSGNFSVSLSRLNPNTTYYFVAGYYDGEETFYGEVKSFKTLAANRALTKNATNITSTGATLSGHYDSTDSNPEYGIIYGTSSNISITSGTRVVASSSSNGDFSVNVSGLAVYTRYYYRAYLLSEGEYYYGNVQNFTTKEAMDVNDVVATETSKNKIGATRAYLYGYYESIAKKPEYGIIYGTTTNLVYSTHNTSECKTVTVGSGSDNSGYNYAASISGLNEKTTYYYRAFLKVGDDIIYGDVWEFMTKEKGLQRCPDDNHPHMIDLGLPSGIKWSCCNVGATRPEEPGGYYAWGETSTKSEYTWANYQYNNGPTHWDYISIGSDISGTQYDAAHVLWGGTWCMPNRDEANELFLMAVIGGLTELTYENGVLGHWFTSWWNDARIFFPNATLYPDADYILYRTSTVDESFNSMYFIEFNEYGVGVFSPLVDLVARYQGYPIRPISK